MTNQMYDSIVFGMSRGDDTKKLREGLVRNFGLSNTKANVIIKQVRKDLKEKRGEKRTGWQIASIKADLRDGIKPEKVVEIVKTWGIPTSDARSMVDQAIKEGYELKGTV
jgi:hypothetical protein